MKTLSATGLFAVFLAVTLCGCLGSHAPKEVYLRVNPPSKAEAACTQKDVAEKPVIMIRNMDSLPVLSGQTVILAEDSVLQPSTTWQWEGKPSELLGKLIASNLSCTTKYKVDAKYSSRVQNVALLYGDIKSFEVVTGSNPKFRLAVNFELWTSRGKGLIVTRQFGAEKPLSAMNPAAIADAADAAIGEMLEHMAGWLDSINLEE